MNHSKSWTSPLALWITLGIVFCGVDARRRSREGSTLQEYKPFVPHHIFQKLVSIYSNKSLLVIDKLKELDDIFMSLPDETLSKLPTPKAFRRLPKEVQSKVHSIYYNKAIPFEDKLKRLEDLVHNLPHEQMKLIPVHTDLPGLIEFDVPVLLQFNGQIVSRICMA